MDSEVMFSHSCRICSIQFDNGTFIFGDEGKQMYLQAKIRKYLYITITIEDKLPKMICENCCKKLDGIHKFATMALKIQDDFNKFLAHSTLEPKKIEPKGLLHTYLTKGIKEREHHESEVTEMEVKVDPMLVLQCTLQEEEDFSTDTFSDSDSDRSKFNIDFDEELIQIEPNQDLSPLRYDCNVCSTSCDSESDLENHMWLHVHSDENEEKDVEEKTSTTEEECLETSAEKLFTCPICSKTISTKGNLKVHLETHRPKGKYACDICGRIFKTQCNLHRHKEYHEGIQFPCEVCGRVYPTNSTLRAHSITHSDLRPHKCPLCEKTFKRNQDLKFHINQHTGARPYQCPYCPKAFASSGNCFSHRKRMHPIEVERDREKAAKIMR